MSRTIAESVSLLSETLGNCKTNLKEKEVADVDNIKISDVDEKIAEIQAGGGDNHRLSLENCTYWVDEYIGKYCIIVWSVSDPESERQEFYKETGDEPKFNQTIRCSLKSGYQSIGFFVFECSETPIELGYSSTYEYDSSYFYSGLIDISKPILYFTDKYNGTEGQPAEE